MKRPTDIKPRFQVRRPWPFSMLSLLLAVEAASAAALVRFDVNKDGGLGREEIIYMGSLPTK